MKAVVFDMDGVIFDSERCIIECWKVIADKYNIRNIESAAYKCLGVNAEASAKIFSDTYGPDFPYMEIRREMFDYFRTEYIEKTLPVKKGVREMLEYLKGHGYPVALASSTKRELVLKELTTAGLVQYFDEIICGDQVTRSKPFPDIFLKACEMIHVKPSEAFAIEDSYNGIRSAHAANMHPIMVPDLLPPIDEITQLADTVQPSLAEALEYVKPRLSV